MQAIINQYSVLWVAGAILLLAGLIILKQKPKISDFIALGVVLLGLVVAWSILRPQQTPLMDNAQAVQDMIGAGTPVLLEFQSPY